MTDQRGNYFICPKTLTCTKSIELQSPLLISIAENDETYDGAFATAVDWGLAKSVGFVRSLQLCMACNWCFSHLNTILHTILIKIDENWSTSKL